MTGSKWTGFFAFFLGASLGVVAGMLLGPEIGRGFEGRPERSAE